MKKSLGCAALMACAAVCLSPAAHASEISSALLRALATQASAGDHAALAELRAVSAIDGQPARIGAALQTRSDAELTARLRTLAATGPPTRLSPAAAQREASAILAAGRFDRAPLKNPVTTVFDKIGRALGRLARGAPGGPVAFWAVVGALVLALTAVGVRRMMRRLDPLAAATAARDVSAADTPEALERQAQEAEQRGAFADAVRLRFRAGLLALGSRKLIDYNPALLTSEVARRLHSPRFDALASSFERIAYGGAPAGAQDAAAARDGWHELARERRR
jgi:hypothetical protein